jgi:hypothetical protein
MQDFDEAGISLADQLNAIQPVSTEAATSGTLTTESQYIELGVELLKEVGSYVCVAACAWPNGKEWSQRNQGIVLGHFARLFKMIQGVLDQTCQHRRDTTMVFVRLCFETTVNVTYLIVHGNDAVFDRYVLSSLSAEKRLLDRIEKDIAVRSGLVLPIEDRMRRSIEASANAAGFSIDDPRIPKRVGTSWAEASLFERAEKVGLDQIYLAHVSLASHSVHGSWQDLIEFHLDVRDEGYRTDLKWSEPKPQHLMSTATVALRAVQAFFASVLQGAELELTEERLNNLRGRVHAANVAHGAFVISQSKEAQGGS